MYKTRTALFSNLPNFVPPLLLTCAADVTALDFPFIIHFFPSFISILLEFSRADNQANQNVKACQKEQNIWRSQAETL